MRDTFWVFALSGLVGNIQEFATDQTKIQRYAAAKSDKDAIIATWTVGIGCIPLWSMFMLVGTVLWVFYGQFPGLLPDGLQADKVYPYFIMNEMNPFVGGLVISAVLAAAMSSIDSSMNGTATVVTADFYRRHFAPGKSDTHYLYVARVVTVILGALAILVAYGLWALGKDSILDTLFVLGSVFAAGLGGFFIVGFISQRVNQQGAGIGLATGVAVILWATGSQAGWIPESWAFGWHPFLINVVGNIAVLVVGFLASYFFKAPIQKAIRGMTWWTREETSDVVRERAEEARANEQDESLEL